jgi:hypothetical protein
MPGGGGWDWEIRAADVGIEVCGGIAVFYTVDVVGLALRMGL